MPGILETLRGKMAHATSGGLLSGLGGSGGILSGQLGLLQSRLATAQAATGGPMAKIQAVIANSSTTLGARLRSGGLLSGLGAGSPAAAPAATDSFQVAGASRIYSSPTRPAGIEYK